MTHRVYAAGAGKVPSGILALKEAATLSDVIGP